jgi:predicted aminopeptidase
LSATKNYTRYVAMDKDYIADVVSACAQDSFERHYWRYPVLGALPYKGFYEKADADAEAARLKKAGFDVIVRRVDAFSSLGYFTDPLYSFMAEYDEDVIAELIIHESAHATLFIKGADQFNEEFATFIGRKGAERYLEDRYGADSEQLAARRRRAADGAAFTGFLKGTAALLDDVYRNPALTKEEKLERKAGILSARASDYRAEAGALFAGEEYRAFDMGAVNNAYIDLYRLYEEDLGLYEAWFDRVAGGSLTEFVGSLTGLAETAGKDIKTAMAKALEG